MTRIQLASPKIAGSADAPSGCWVACEKYDGPNVPWVWDQEGGGYAFGMRRNRFDVDEAGIADFNADHPGYIDPEQFIADFGTLNIVRVVYRGKLTGTFIHEVREGRYDVTEGVICKGGAGDDDVWMVKIKTRAYMERLKQAFKDDWENYWE